MATDQAGRDRIDIRTEQLIPLRRVTQIPSSRTGEPLDVSSLYKLVNSGELAAIHTGGTICTSLEAIQRYLDRQTDAYFAKRGRTREKAGPGRTSAGRRKAIEKAEKELASLGV